MNPKIVIGLLCIAASPLIVLGKIDRLPLVSKKLCPGSPFVIHSLLSCVASPVEKWILIAVPSVIHGRKLWSVA